MYKKHIWTDDQIALFWDYESQFPKNYWALNNGKILIRKFLKQLKNSKKILDLGCGDGGLLHNLLPLSKKHFPKAEIYGFDTSHSSIGKLNYGFKSFTQFKGGFTCQERLRNTLGESKFDFIFCCEVVEHVYDKSLNCLFKTAKDLLAKNGRFLISTPNNEDLKASYIFNPIDGSVFHRWQHVRSWNRDSLSQYAKTFNLYPTKTIETNTLWDSKFPLNLAYRIKYKEKTNLFMLFRHHI